MKKSEPNTPILLKYLRIAERIFIPNSARYAKTYLTISLPKLPTKKKKRCLMAVFHCKNSSKDENEKLEELEEAN